MPIAARTSSSTGTCGDSSSGTTSRLAAGAAVSPPTVIAGCASATWGVATRWVLYDGISCTRQAGRQSRSRQATTRVGLASAITRLMMSSEPRTALTGRPFGAVIDDGTAKNARK